MKPISKLFFMLLFTLWPHKIVGQKEIPDLIPLACDHTLHKDLCRVTLESDPESQEATDVHGLVSVAIKHAATNATQIRNYITKLDEESSDEVIHQCLTDCFENYQDAADQLDDSLSALESKGYDDVNTWVTAAMNYAVSCEEGFKNHGRKSLLADLRNTFDQLCSIVLSLTDQLKDKEH